MTSVARVAGKGPGSPLFSRFLRHSPVPFATHGDRPPPNHPTARSSPPHPRRPAPPPPYPRAVSLLRRSTSLPFSRPARVYGRRFLVVGALSHSVREPRSRFPPSPLPSVAGIGGPPAVYEESVGPFGRKITAGTGPREAALIHSPYRRLRLGVSLTHFASRSPFLHSLRRVTHSGVSRGRALSVHPPHSRLRHSWPPAARRVNEERAEGTRGGSFLLPLPSLRYGWSLLTSYPRYLRVPFTSLPTPHSSSFPSLRYALSVHILVPRVVATLRYSSRRDAPRLGLVAHRSFPSVRPSLSPPLRE